jgi:signal transduction histidine kinase
MSLVLLGVSGMEAYRIVRSDGTEHNAAKRSFDQRQQAITAIRDLLNQAQAMTRDLLLSDEPERSRLFRKRMEALSLRAEATFGQLERAGVVPASEVTELRKEWKNFMAIVQQPLAWDDTIRRKRALKFFTQLLAASRRPAQQITNRLATINGTEFAERSRLESAERFNSVCWLIGCTCFVLLLAAGAGRILTVNLRDLGWEYSRKLEEVMRHKSELGKLSARLLAIQETERKSLSRELHDGIGQILTALRVELSLVPSSSLAERSGCRLRRATSLAEEAIRTTRNIALLLRPSLLDELGLDAALCAQAEDFSRRTGIECQLTVDGLRDDLPEDIKTCVYRVVQEALNNCQKHSSALHVTIRVRQANDSLHVTVADDGLGFDLNGSSSVRGIGLIGMRERAASVGGQFGIQTLHRGAQIVLSIPLRGKATTGDSLDTPSLADNPVNV